jgi:carbamate kinase
MEKKQTILVALGGNAMIRKGQVGTVQEQFENLRVPIRQLARLSQEYNLIITHGNGPQVGNLLLQQELSRDIPKLPLEILVAQTQGQVGYMIESSLDSELMALGIIHQKPIVSLITYVVVAPDDPAFSNPSKPIGPVYSSKEAARMPFPTRKTTKGYRRVVASPKPLSIIEKREISKLMGMGFIVICCGGGGIPVIREGRSFCGVDAVIDKDLASGLLAREVGVDLFIMATDVEGAMIHFGSRREKVLRRVTVAQAERYLKEGHFPPGSMQPKVEAALQFVRKTSRSGFITSTAGIEKAVTEAAGTQFVR